MSFLGVLWAHDLSGFWEPLARAAQSRAERGSAQRIKLLLTQPQYGHIGEARARLVIVRAHHESKGKVKYRVRACCQEVSHLSSLIFLWRASRSCYHRFLFKICQMNIKKNKDKSLKNETTLHPHSDPVFLKTL